MFFEGNDIKQEKIRDLSGMGHHRKSIPLDMEFMLENYIEILEMRTKKIKEEIDDRRYKGLST
jgi:hypothetical protein